MASHLKCFVSDLGRMSSEEMTYWIAYYKMHPFGEERADLRIAILSSLTANINRGKNGKVFRPEDFMPKFHEYDGPAAAQPRHTAQELGAKFAQYAALHNAAFERKKKLRADHGDGK